MNREYYSISGSDNYSSIEVSIDHKFLTPYTGNETVFGKTNDGNPVFAKLFRFDGAAEREWRGLSLAHLNKIHVPTPIAYIYDSSSNREGIITDRIDGSLLSDVDEVESRYVTGLELNKLHEIPTDGFGLIDAETNRATYSGAPEYIEFWLDKTMPHIGGSLLPSILNELLIASESEIETSQPAFSHRDLSERNVIINSAGEAVLIDFEWWQGGDRLEDVGIYLYHAISTNQGEEIMKAFLEGYTSNDSLSDGEKEVVLFYLALTAGRIVSFCSRLMQNKLEEAHENSDQTSSFIKNEKLFKM